MELDSYADRNLLDAILKGKAAPPGAVIREVAPVIDLRSQLDAYFNERKARKLRAPMEKEVRRTFTWYIECSAAHGVPPESKQAVHLRIRSVRMLAWSSDLMSAKALILLYLNAQLLHLRQLAGQHKEPLRSEFLSDAKEIEQVLDGIKSGEMVILDHRVASDGTSQPG